MFHYLVKTVLFLLHATRIPSNDPNMAPTNLGSIYVSSRVLLETTGSTPSHILTPAAIYISEEGTIRSVIRADTIEEIQNIVSEETHYHVSDVGNLVIMPGLVDSHVHINEPGRIEWEGFESGTKAAAAGGITTIADMPLNSIPSTISVSALTEKLEAARDKCRVDVAFWGGVVPGNQDELRPLLEAGVRGFKCFLIDSGVEEFPNVKEDDVNKALEMLQDTGTVLMFHAELPARALPALQDMDRRQYETFLRSKPDGMEVEAVKLVGKLCEKYRVRCHIVHVSSKDCLPIIRAMKDSGINLTAETTPHYLTLDADQVPIGATQYKCVPPIRKKENQDALWSGLTDNTLDMIVSDHSPCTADLKLLDTGDFIAAWGGISSLQLVLPLIWTSASRRGLPVTTLSPLLSSSPANLLSLHDRKGAIREGLDADLVVWDPDDVFTVEPEKLQHKNKLTPYEGLLLRGVVHRTILRGHLIYDRDQPDLLETSKVGKLLIN